MDFAFDINEVIDGLLPVPFEVLLESEGYAERWLTDVPTKAEQKATFHQWINDEYLVVLMVPTGDQIDGVTRSVYQMALNQATELGFEHLIRTWNFFPRINQLENGVERYQQFCVARQDVLNQFPQFEVQNPAATAIGTQQELNNFVFLFARSAGVGVENKRQLSAWQYPKRYAPKQPRFARAMTHSGLLICSGTASVVGHETAHIGDVTGQLKESLVNVESLIKASGENLVLGQGYFRFYLRDSEDLTEIGPVLSQLGLSRYIVLSGDVCRSDLLVECEAVFQI